MFKNIFNYFDKLEDRTRGKLSRFPIIYTLIGAIAIVLFWRGVWHTADILESRGGFLGLILYEPVSILIVIIILLITGLFVSNFIGDAIIVSGLKQQKKINEKTEKEVEDSEITLNKIQESIKDIKDEVDEIRDVVKHQ